MGASLRARGRTWALSERSREAVRAGWRSDKEPESAATESDRFRLIDSSGANGYDRAYRGNWFIVFFGFTHCG